MRLACRRRPSHRTDPASHSRSCSSLLRMISCGLTPVQPIRVRTSSTWVSLSGGCSPDIFGAASTACTTAGTIRQVHRRPHGSSPDRGHADDPREPLAFGAVHHALYECLQRTPARYRFVRYDGQAPVDRDLHRDPDDRARGQRPDLGQLSSTRRLCATSGDGDAPACPYTWILTDSWPARMVPNLSSVLVTGRGVLARTRRHKLRSPAGS